MAEDRPYNPDFSGTHPDSQPVPHRPDETMAEAFASLPTAVRVQPDGSHIPINPEAYAAHYGLTEQTVASRTDDVEAQPFTIDTRLIDGQSHLCAIDPDGNIITSRGQGSTGSPELYELVFEEAQRIMREADRYNPNE